MTTPITKAALSSPRALAAWALVGYVALSLFFSFFDWILPGDGSFTGRSAGANFDNLLVMAMPVVAVMFAVHVAPAVSGAKLIATIALVEYAVALFFGVVALLIGLGGVFDGVGDANDVFDALGYLVMGVAALALIAVAAYVTLRAFTGLGGKFPVGQSRSTPTIARQAPPA